LEKGRIRRGEEERKGWRGEELCFDGWEGRALLYICR
jgi:hypothetical protein